MTYDYKCQKCGETFEGDPRENVTTLQYSVCHCGGVGVRLFSPPAVHFKFTTGNPPPDNVLKEMQDYGIDTEAEYGAD